MNPDINLQNSNPTNSMSPNTLAVKKNSLQFTAVKFIGACIGGYLAFMGYQWWAGGIDASSLQGKLNTTTSISTEQSASGNIPSQNLLSGNIQDEEYLPEDPKEKEKLKNIIEQSTEKNSAAQKKTEFSLKASAPFIQAGNAVFIETTPISPNVKVQYRINSEELFNEYTAVTNNTGVSIVQVPGSFLQKAGTYKIRAEANGVSASNSLSLTVRAQNTPSASESKLMVESNSIKKGASTKVSVKLLDEFSNPISDHTITLLTSNGSQINPAQMVTDDDGEAQFTYQNNQGASTKITALDKTTGVLLESSLTIDNASGDTTYLHTLPSNIFSYLVPKAYAQSNVSYFSISGVDDRVNALTPITFTLTAYDESGEVATGYTGSVSFSSTDTKADLPNNYTFKATDKGEKTFVGGMTFSGVGNYIVTVTDSADDAITGSLKVEVFGTTSGGGNSSDKPISIVSPTKNSTLNTNSIDIAGKTKPKSDIEIYDGDIKLGNVLSGDDGVFIYTTNNLTDGKHSIKAKSALGESEAIEITIDTNSPELDNIKISPETIKPGTPVQIEIQTEKNLQKVKIITDGKGVDLEQSDNGIYKGTFVAPSLSGSYSIDIELTDEVGNPQLFSAVKSYQVTSGDNTDIAFIPSNEPPLVSNTDTNENRNSTTQIPFNNESGPTENIVALLAILSIIIVGYREKWSN